jgi:uncharacterized secreted protein with C-terminal beta-propeller domain
MKALKVRSAVTGLLAAACLIGVGMDASASSSTPRPSTGMPASLSGADLVSYTSCAQLLQQVKTQALNEVGPYGLPGPSDGYNGLAPVAVVRPGPVALAAPTAATGTGAPSPSASAPANGGAGQGYSTTNDQEAGVDEPDIVKTNGQVMVVLRQGPLGVQVLDVSGSTPRLDGFLPLPQLAEADGVFLVGDEVYVIGSGPSAPVPVRYVGGRPATGTAVPGAAGHPTQAPSRAVTHGAMVPAPLLPWGGVASTTDVVVVSVADPQNPSVVRAFSFQGQDQGARLINGQVTLALTNQPRFVWSYPANGTPAAAKAALAANKALIRSSKASGWLPSETVISARGPSVGGTSALSTGNRHLPSAVKVTKDASCDRTYHTVVGSGLGTVSVISLDPSSSAPGNEVTVVGNAETVYASASQVYVATTDWRHQVLWGCSYGPGVACPMEPAHAVGPGFTSLRTDIYGFDISNASGPQYLGSGSVPGTLIGQYAMSEFDGYLRVATTVGEPTPAPVDGGSAPAELSDNTISVLRPGSGSLVTVGALHGLGKGEKIYAVRFVGDLGYVVTFNQTDPLYVVDLSNPEQPALSGQVALSGYSSFLQPLGDSLLLGIGEAVDQELRTEGLQLEVFDVAQPGQPVLDSRQQLGSGASSTAEYDPHALLWWPQSNLLVLPVDDYASSMASSAADVWSVSASGALTQLGTLTQPGSSQNGYPEIERAVIVGNDIYTVSEQGVMASNMSSLSQVAWLAYQNTSP